MNDPSIKSLLSSLNITPSKKMGQNFLSNSTIAQQIATLVINSKADAVVEIGPGTGAITQHLITMHVPFVAIELDKRLCEYLHNQYHKIPYFTLINNDILKVDWDLILNKYHNPIIVSNLPYSISSQVIIRFLKQNICKEFYCMLQKEMTERLDGKINTKQYNAFSALTQRYTNVEVCMKVASANFFPQPLVDSVVIKLTRNALMYEPHYDLFLKQCFHSRRQTLINNLKHYYDIKIVVSWLNQHKYSEKIRSEAITPDDLYALYQEVYHG